MTEVAPHPILPAHVVPSCFVLSCALPRLTIVPPSSRHRILCALPCHSISLVPLPLQVENWLSLSAAQRDLLIQQAPGKAPSPSDGGAAPPQPTVNGTHSASPPEPTAAVEAGKGDVTMGSSLESFVALCDKANPTLPTRHPPSQPHTPHPTPLNHTPTPSHLTQGCRHFWQSGQDGRHREPSEGPAPRGRLPCGETAAF